MSNHTSYTKAPCPRINKHRAPQTAQQAWEDYYGIGAQPQGRRAAR